MAYKTQLCRKEKPCLIKLVGCWIPEEVRQQVLPKRRNHFTTRLKTSALISAAVKTSNLALVFLQTSNDLHNAKPSPHCRFMLWAWRTGLQHITLAKHIDIFYFDRIASACCSKKQKTTVLFLSYIFCYVINCKL
jgi:hypothetical protein